MSVGSINREGPVLAILILAKGGERGRWYQRGMWGSVI